MPLQKPRGYLSPVSTSKQWLGKVISTHNLPIFYNFSGAILITFEVYYYLQIITAR
jgi:hypothetical protein